MEFVAGVVFTLFIEFIGYKIYQARERRKKRQQFNREIANRKNQ